MVWGRWCGRLRRRRQQGSPERVIISDSDTDEDGMVSDSYPFHSFSPEGYFRVLRKGGGIPGIATKLGDGCVVETTTVDGVFYVRKEGGPWIPYFSPMLPRVRVEENNMQVVEKDNTAKGEDKANRKGKEKLLFLRGCEEEEQFGTSGEGDQGERVHCGGDLKGPEDIAGKGDEFERIIEAVKEGKSNTCVEPWDVRGTFDSLKSLEGCIGIGEAGPSMIIGGDGQESVSQEGKGGRMWWMKEQRGEVIMR